MDNRITYGSQTLTDANIYGGVEYTKTINSNTNLQPGDVAAAQIKFTLKDRLFDIDDELVYSVGSLLIGKFYVKDIQKNKNSYTITAYDGISKLDGDCFDYVDHLTYPITLRNLFTQAASNCGFLTNSADTSSRNMVNSSHNVYVNNINQGTTFRQLFSYIAEANGCFIECQYASGSGNEVLRLRKYGYSTGSTVFINSNCKSLEEADYNCPHITRVWHGASNDDIGTSSGTGDVVLKIYNNPFFYIDNNNTETKVRTALSNILSVLPQTDYVPFKLTTFNENVGLIAGQNVSVYGTNRPVFSISWNKSGFTVSSTGDASREQENNYGFNEIKMNGAYNKLSRTLDGTISEVSKKVDGDQIISTINQSAEAVTINANKINLTGYLTISAGDQRYDASGAGTSAANTAVSNLQTSMANGTTTISGNCIKTGTIKLGGQNNGNGKLEVYNASSTKMGQWTNTGEIIWDDTTYANSKTGNATFKILRTGDAVDSHYGVFEGVTTNGSITKYPFINLKANDSGSSSTYIVAGDEQLSKVVENSVSKVTYLNNVGATVINMSESIYNKSAATTETWSTQIDARPIGLGNLITRTGGCTITSQSSYVWGRIAQITLVCWVSANSGYYAGANLFTGTISNYKPISAVMGGGYFGPSGYSGLLNTDGSITIRCTGSWPSYEGNFYISWTYLVGEKQI